MSSTEQFGAPAGAGSAPARGLVERFAPRVPLDGDRRLRQRLHLFLVSHLAGPLLGLPIPVLLFASGGLAQPHVWVLAASIAAFWLFPVGLRTGLARYETLVLGSVMNLLFAVLWVSYHYGGVTSPFQIWLAIVPLLVFFYLGSNAFTRSWVLAVLGLSIGGFYGLHLFGHEYPSHLSGAGLASVGMVSTLCAAVYGVMMAVHYGRLVDDAERGLEDANRNLETRVAERTAELTQANDTLRNEVLVRTRSEERMRHMAYHDGLTSLPNRMAFQERLRDEIAQAEASGRSAAVLCLDLDRFREINDTLGHSFGDLVLCEVAARLSGSLREGDMLARLGGDEFAVVVPFGRRHEEVSQTVERLQRVLARPIDIDGEAVYTGATVGIAFYPADGRDPEALLKAADTALNRAKGEGRGGFRFFEDGMNAVLERRRATECALRRAVRERQFHLLYQPIVAMGSRRPVGCEALVRWHDPERGIISPAEFIPLAEETGLIVEIGEWVLRTACAEAAQWPGGPTLAVNVSPVQLKHGDLVQVVSRAIAEAGLDPWRLELEVTEGMLLDDAPEVLQTLMDIKRLGVRLSLDDFGTGFSALGYLLKYPFDKIKVDRSFVAGLGHDHRSETIVHTVLGLAAGLQMTAVAEGVETEAQAALLTDAGCAQGQGYLFAKPLDPREVGAIFRALAGEMSTGASA